MAWERRSIMALAGAVAALSIPGAPRAADQADPAIAAVEAVLKRQVEDWNKGDLDGFLAGYWKSPRVVFQSGGERVDGWEAMRERYRRRYQADGRAMGQLEFVGLEIEPLAKTTAFARGGWRLTMPDGSRPSGLFTLILREMPEGWKITHDHTSAQQSAPPPPPTRAPVPTPTAKAGHS